MPSTSKRPNLSFDHFAALVGALGVSTAVACGGGGGAPPVQANEVAPAGPASAAGHASCSAAGCGANKAGNAAAAPVTTGPEPSAAAMGAATPDSSAAPAVASAAPAGSGGPAKPVAKKKGPVKTMPTGEASCGAGTCSSNTKKIL